MHSIARILSVLVLLASRTVLASPIVARTDAPTCLINGIKYTPAEAKDAMNSGKYDQATNAAFRDCCDKNQPAANADSDRMGPNQFNAVQNTTSPLDGAKKGEQVDANAQKPGQPSTTFPLDGAKKGEHVDAKEPTKSSTIFPLDPAGKGAKLDAKEKDKNAEVEEYPNEEYDVNSPKNAKDGKVGQQSQGVPATGADVGDLHNTKGTNQNTPSVMDMQLTRPSETAQVGQSNKPATIAKANGAPAQAHASESGPAGESGNADVQRKRPTPSAQTPSTQPMMDVKMASPLSFSEGAKGDEHTGTPAVSTPKEDAQVNESNASGKSASGDKSAKATDKNAKVDASESGPAPAAENETLSTNGATSQGKGTPKESAKVTQSNSPGNENAKATASTDKNASEDPAACADPEENVNVNGTGAHRQGSTAASANSNQGKGSEENAKLEGGEPFSAGMLSNLEEQLGGEKAAAKKAAAANEQTCTCPQ